MWHWSLAVHVTGFPPVHVPDWQVSVRVQALPSLHPVPSGLAGFEQAPVALSHMPMPWHWSLAAHTTGFEPVQVPAWQVSARVQASPSLHPVPSGLAGFEQVPVIVSHVPAPWH